MDLSLPMKMATDPVCGMQVDPKTTSHKAEHSGTAYFFCSRGCMLDFQETPEKYLDPSYEPGGMEDMQGH